MIKNILKKIVRRLSHTQGVTDDQIRALEGIINIRNLEASESVDSNSNVSIIIFSKDRAIQLHALLASFFELVKGDATIYVLYTISDYEHETAYEDVRKIFKEQNVKFIKEKDFRRDLIEVLDAISTKKMFFLVDDIIFTEPFELSDFIKYNTKKYVPSLRMGRNLTYAYTTQQEQPLPNFIRDELADNNKFIWKWENGSLDWGYPLSVDGHLFDSREIGTLIKNSNFKAPNTLEESLQLYNNIYKTRYGLCYNKSVIVNIPCNKVQLENNNISGNMTPTTLLSKWNEGYQIDYKKLFSYNNISAHQDIELEFIKRTQI